MYVSDWMTKKVYAVEPDEYLSDALSVMKEQSIIKFSGVPDAASPKRPYLFVFRIPEIR